MERNRIFYFILFTLSRFTLSSILYVRTNSCVEYKFNTYKLITKVSGQCLMFTNGSVTPLVSNNYPLIAQNKKQPNYVAVVNFACVSVRRGHRSALSSLQTKQRQSHIGPNPIDCHVIRTVRCVFKYI